MLNLLRNNSSNQQFFKEGSYIQRLAPMFVLPPEIEETGMTAEKVSNLHSKTQLSLLFISHFHLKLYFSRYVTSCSSID